jgi:hypothetical protein
MTGGEIEGPVLARLGRKRKDKDMTKKKTAEAPLEIPVPSNTWDADQEHIAALEAVLLGAALEVGTVPEPPLISGVELFFKCRRPLPRDAQDEHPGICGGEVRASGTSETQFATACAKCGQPFVAAIAAI